MTRAHRTRLYTNVRLALVGAPAALEVRSLDVGLYGLSLGVSRDDVEDGDDELIDVLFGAHTCL